MLDRTQWTRISFWAAVSLSLIVAGRAMPIQPSEYSANNEVIYTNQSTGQSTPNVSDLCNLGSTCLCIQSCPGLLLDGDTASTDNGNIDLQKFWAFNGSSDGTVRIIAPSNTPVSFIVLYFYNSPKELIGLPDIEITSNLVANSVSYVFTDNNDLSQTDSQVRNVTLSLTQSEYNFNIQFLFPDSNKIQYMLISEMGLMDEGPVPSLDLVEFLNDIPSEMTLGPDNPQSSVSFSCTVTNSGSFEWQWQHNGSPVDTSRSQIWTADATRTSILIVDRLRYTDTGNYTCDVQYSTNNTIYSRSIVLSLVVEVSALTSVVNGEEGEDVILSCEMYGYLTEGIVWIKDGQLVQPGASYAISSRFGDRVGQDGGETTTSSVISELTVLQLEQQDNGTYVCRAEGTTVQNQVDLLIGISTMSNQPTIPDLTTTSGATPTAPSSSPSSVVAIIIPVVIVVILVMALAVVLILVFYFRKRRMGKTGSVSYRNYGNGVHDISHDKIKVIQNVVLKEEEAELDGIENELTYSTVVKTPPEIPPQNFTPDLQDFNQMTKQPIDLEQNAKRSPIPRKLSHTVTGVDLQSNPLYQPANEAMGEVPFAEYSQVGPVESTYASVYSDPSTIRSTAVQDIGIYAEASEPDSSCPVYSEPGAVDLAHALYSEPDAVGLARAVYSEPDAVSTQDESAQVIISPIYAEPVTGRQLKQVTELNENQINILESLGTGQFGEVLLAETIGVSLKELGLSDFDNNKEISVQVAIKRMKEGTDEKTRKSFEKEMKFMSQLDHVNVLRLLAVKSSDPPFMALEYMENGDLSQFLRKHDFTSEHPPETPFGISSQILLSMTMQVVSGMAYLASLNFIHRDLAIRNCLVGSNHQVKIADFGLSRSLYDSAYYRVKGRAKMPIRWMATECFYGKFSEKSDVWAYGVVVWEIYTIGREVPYKELTDREVIDDAIKGPRRSLLARPEHCPQEVFDIIVKCCWPFHTNERATFEGIHDHLVRLPPPDL